MTKTPHGLIVSGSRDLTNEHYHYVKHGIESWARMFGKPTIIIHGAQRGADALGKHWAGCRDIPHDPHEVTPEEWRRIGPKAGPLRNGRMVALPYAHGLVVVRFLDSKGSKDCFTQATRAGLPTLDIVVPR